MNLFTIHSSPSLSSLIKTHSTTLGGLVTVALTLYIVGPSLKLNLYQLNPFSILQRDPENDPEMLTSLRRKKRMGRYTVGLSNRANDCFANSNLQALASLNGLYLYLNEFNYLVAANTKSDSNEREQINFLLSDALCKMIRDLNEPVLSPKCLTPWTLLGVLEKIYRSKISRSQHDAHELLHLILETLQHENDTLRKRLRQRGQEPPPTFTFNGQTVDRITCSKCGYCPPANPSAFLVQSLMVPQKRAVHLSDMLSQLSTAEYIKDYGCTNCRMQYVLKDPNGQFRHDFKRAVHRYRHDPGALPEELEQQLPREITSPIAKCTNFYKLPQVLTIHLSRSIYGGYGASRNSCKVAVSETLELFEQTSQSKKFDAQGGFENAANFRSGNKKVQYRLAAMIRHKGTHQTGHYECFRRKNLGFWDALQQEQEMKNSSSSSLAAMQLSKAMQAAGAAAAPTPASASSSRPASTCTSTSAPPNVACSTTTTATTTAPSGTSPPKTASKAPNPTNLSNIATEFPPVPPPVPPKQELPYPYRSSPSPASLSTSEITASATTPAGEQNGNGNGQGNGHKSANASTWSVPSSVSSAQTVPAPSPPSSSSASNVLPPSANEWWKISDDKVWECSTRDVLKEESGAYLLFYEAC